MSQDKGQQFLDKLADADTSLPFSPAILSVLFSQTRDDSTASMEDIARTIAHDQGLTAKVLVMANSAFYGLQSEVSSVSRALAVLGLREIRNIMLMLGVQSLLKGDVPDDFDIREYWRHQLLVAQTARRLASEDKGLDADDLYTAGLLHDLGKLITAMQAPDDFRAIQDLLSGGELTASMAEEMHWGLDHAVIGALVLGSWNIPEWIHEPVNWHHDPGLAPEFGPQARVLSAADAMVNLTMAPTYPVKPDWRETVAELNLSPREALALTAEAYADESIWAFVDSVIAAPRPGGVEEPRA